MLQEATTRRWLGVAELQGCRKLHGAALASDNWQCMLHEQANLNVAEC